jgi:hypothetical protein
VTTASWGPDAGKAGRFSAWYSQLTVSAACCPCDVRYAIVRDARKDDHQPTTTVTWDAGLYGLLTMKIRFSPLLLAGVAMLALSSAVNAAQPLTDRQMDGVTAGLENNLIAIANASAVAIGNLDAETATFTITITDQGVGAAVATSAAPALSPAALLRTSFPLF